MNLMEQATIATQQGPASGLWVLIASLVIVVVVICVDSALRDESF
jgi:hypothetical protein